MAIDFPNNPSVNDIFWTGGRSYVWNGVTWQITSEYLQHAPTHASAGTDPILISQSQVIDLISNLSAKAPSASPTLTGPVVIDTNSASNALRITQTGSGNALVVEDSSNPDATPFIISASGTVGIGKIPSYLLDVDGIINATSYYVNGLPLDLLPSQTGNQGKYLTTDGTAASWTEVEIGQVQTDVLLSNSWWLGV